MQIEYRGVPHMERLNYRWADYGDYREIRNHDDYEEDQEREYRPWHYDLFDDEFRYEEEDYAEASQEEVEHHEDYAEDDNAETGFEARFGWRSKARHGRKGRFVPPDTRGYVPAVFVRLADLEVNTASGSVERGEPAP